MIELDIWLLKHLDLSFFGVLFQNDLFQWIYWDHQYLDLTCGTEVLDRAAASPRSCLALCKLHLNLTLCCRGDFYYFLSITVDLQYLVLPLSTVWSKCSMSFPYRGKNAFYVCQKLPFLLEIHVCLFSLI